jgi:hypothetical protein
MQLSKYIRVVRQRIIINTQFRNKHIEIYMHPNINEIVARTLPPSLAKYNGLCSKRCRIS